MKPEEKKLLNILSNNNVTFFIPPYQRNYEWTTEQCKVFLEDVKKTYEQNVSGKPSEHFFGTVTYFQDETDFDQPDKLVLIDGQQRITTTMLFLAALRDLILDQDWKNLIDSKFLKNNNVSGDSEYKIKLKQVEADWEVYKKIILGEMPKTVERNTVVFQNYKYFFSEIAKMLADGVDLSQFISKGLQKFSIITIELKPKQNEWENPQEIFESMNSLGKPLSLADLVRNYLMLGLDADAQDHLYKTYWLHIEQLLPGQVSNFIRDYMQTKECRSLPKATENNYKDLYRAFKQLASNYATEELLEELYEYAEVYYFLMLNNDPERPKPDWKPDWKLKWELDCLKRINVTTAYSFLMEILMRWHKGQIDDQDIVDFLHVFFIYSLRRRILGLAAGENKNFPTLTRYVDSLVNAKEKKRVLFNLLARQENNLRLPNDIELKRHMETMNFYNLKYCRFILALTEKAITKSFPDLSDPNLQVEHIMPRTLNEEWERELGPDFNTIHQELVDTIGNLTLIRHNPELGNKPFNEKCDFYENVAGLQIAKTMILNRDTWNKGTIQDRANWIIDYILKNVLPIPDSMRRSNNFAQIDKKKKQHLSFIDLKIVDEDIRFVDDPSIKARVVDDKNVEFEGKIWKLSPLTREIQTRRNALNNSGSYSGPDFWTYQGMRLSTLMQKEGV